MEQSMSAGGLGTRRAIHLYWAVAAVAAIAVTVLAWWVGLGIPTLEARRLALVQLRMLRRAKEQLESYREQLDYRVQVVCDSTAAASLSRQLSTQDRAEIDQAMADLVGVVQLRRHGTVGEELWDWALPGQRVPRLDERDRGEVVTWAANPENRGKTRLDLQEFPPGQGRWIMRILAPVWTSNANGGTPNGFICLWASNAELFERYLIPVHLLSESYSFAIYWKAGGESPTGSLPTLQWHASEPQWVGSLAGDATNFLTAVSEQTQILKDTREDYVVTWLPLRDGRLRREVVAYAPIVFGSQRWVLCLSTPYEVATEISTAQRLFVVLLGLVALGVLLVGILLLYYQRRRLELEAAQTREQQAREMGYQYRSLFAENPTAMLVLNDRAALVDCNYSAERLLGQSRLEVTGAQLTMLFEEDSVGRLWEQLQQKGELHARDAQLIRERDHADLLVEVWGRRIGDQWVLMAHDVGERRDLERQVARLQRMDSMGALASTLAHDFNNLLGQVQILVSHLRTELGGDGRVRENLSAIEAKVEDASRLVADLLAFREDVIAAEPVWLESVIRDFVTSQRSVLPENVRLALEIRREMPAVWITPHAMRRVLSNLCVNARDAMPYGGSLTIRCTARRIEPHEATRQLPADNYAVIIVADTGMGMSENVLDRLFQPFFTTKVEGRGTGLGLWTVYKIIRAAGGWIHVHSQPGKGTRFTIFIPHTHPIPER